MNSNVNLEALGEELKESLADLVAKQEVEWAKLSKENQLAIFCAVMRRLKKAELQDFRSFRGTLYSVFEFGPEAYVLAQEAGFLDIHSAIWDAEQVKTAIHHFCVSELGHEPKDEELDNKIVDYIKRMEY